jgi:hypothetical protein
MSGGYLIQERACPRCAIRRTVRLTAGNSFCFNCRLQWSTQQVARGQPVRWMTALPLTSHPFTPAEQARMAIYRAAVRAVPDAIAETDALHVPGALAKPR